MLFAVFNFVVWPMTITFDFELSADEENRLSRALGCDIADFPQRLGPFARATIREYVVMLAGSRGFTRAADFMELRLLCLIQAVTGNRVPDEDFVSRCFHLTRSQSRTLIRNTVTRFEFELSAAIRESAKSVLSHERQKTTLSSSQAPSLNVVDELNRILERLNPNFRKIVPTFGTLGQFIVEDAEMEVLRQHFGIAAV